MRIEIQGEGAFEVPDDATPGEIAALTAPKPTQVGTALGHAAQGFAFGAAPQAVGLYRAGEGQETGAPLETAGAVLAGLWRKLRGDPEAQKRYEEAVRGERESLAAGKEAFPKTAFASELGGAMASPASKLAPFKAAAGAPLLNRAAASAGNAALGGGLYGFNASEQEGLGARLLDALKVGAVAGPVGAMIPVAGALVSAGARKVVPWAKQLAGEKFAKTSGAIQSDINKVRGGLERVSEAGQTGREEGVLKVMGRPKGTLERAEEALSNVGDRLGQQLPTVTKALESTGRGADTAVTPDLMAVAGRIQKEITAPLRSLGNPDADKLAKFSEDYATSLMNNAAMKETGALPFDAAHDLRRSMDRFINWKDTSQAVQNRLRIQMRKMLDDEISDKLVKAGEALGNKDAGAAWDALNRKYSDLKIIESFARKGTQRAAGNRALSLSDTIAGAAGLASHPGLAPVYALGNKALRSYGSGLQGLGYETLGNVASGLASPAGPTNPSMAALMALRLRAPLEFAPALGEEEQARTGAGR